MRYMSRYTFQGPIRPENCPTVFHTLPYFCDMLLHYCKISFFRWNTPSSQICLSLALASDCDTPSRRIATPNEEDIHLPCQQRWRSPHLAFPCYVWSSFTWNASRNHCLVRETPQRFARDSPTIVLPPLFLSRYTARDTAPTLKRGTYIPVDGRKIPCNAWYIVFPFSLIGTPHTAGRVPDLPRITIDTAVPRKITSCLYDFDFHKTCLTPISWQISTTLTRRLR